MCPANPSQAPSPTPTELVLVRARAFRRGDFGLIWDSSHPRSGFRRMFPERAGYLEYGRTVLMADFTLLECRVLRQDVRGSLARVLSLQVFRHEGVEQAWYEWARLCCEDDRWQVLATARLEQEKFPGPADALDWADFERLDERGFF